MFGAASSLREHELEGYGVVLLVSRGGVIRHASHSAAYVLERDAQALVSASLTDLLSPRDAGTTVAAIAGDVADFGWRPVTLASGRRMKVHAFDCGEGLVGVDLLPHLPEGGRALAVERVAAWNERFLACDTTTDLLEQAAAITAQRTAFEGVWVTQLHADGDGVLVSAHSPNDRVAATVGQRVPGRELLPGQPQIAGRLIPLFIADTAAPATTLFPPYPAADLQASALHRPYPDYLDALGRSGVRALVAIPLVVDGRLWGRISAASPQPSRVPAAIQAELRLLAAAVGGRLTEILAAETAREQDELAQTAARVISAAGAADDLIDGLIADQAGLCSICDADSAIVVTSGRIETVGRPLPPAACDQIIAHASEALGGPRAPVVASTTAVERQEVDPADAAGYLAARITPGSEDLIIWTRREHCQPVRWLQRTADASFPPVSERVEERSGRCRPWTRAQKLQASSLRDALGQLLASRYAKVSQLNEELTRSNLEYDAFAHAAAHDLRSPIRGIQMTTEFLLEDLGAALGPEQRGQIDGILRMTERMRMLLDDLMAYAQVGRAPWQPEPIELQAAVTEAVELLGGRAGDLDLTVTAATYRTDPGGLRQLLMNLIGNAAKYRSPDRPAAVSVHLQTLSDVVDDSSVPPAVHKLDSQTPVLVVSDNGIGIDPAFHDQVFGLFRQLDTGADGSGAGLALCRLIARRHGGDIWLRSSPGSGTTVYVAAG